MKRILASTAGLLIAAGGSVMAAPPATAAPLVTGGLVNVTVTDVIDDVTVTVEDVNVAVGAALALAANVCDVNVNVLATQLRDGGATCSNAVDETTVTIDQV
jgi:hypothetical protein